jgi:serine/threonine protein kinase/ankyrin repeat protein
MEQQITLEDPGLRSFSLEEFIEISHTDPTFAKEIFQNGVQLTKTTLFERLNELTDFYLSFDWGRDYGIDNAKRVFDITHYLTEEKNYSFCKEMQNLKRCHYAIVFLTDRYVRRYREKGYLKEEFDLIINSFPSSRIFFVLIEGRIVHKLGAILEELGVKSDDIHTGEIADYDDNVVGVVLDRLQQSMRKFPSLVFIKRLFDVQSKSQIFQAIEEGNAQLLEEAITKGYCTPNDKNMDGYPLLHLSIMRNHAACVKVLLKHNVDVKQVEEEELSNPLHLACCGDNMEIFDLLIDHPDIGINQANSWKLIPSHIAAQRNDKEMLAKLAARQADLTLPDRGGQNVLDMLSSDEVKAFIESILEERRAILVAVQQDDLNKVKELLSKAKDPKLEVNRRNEDGRSPLFFARSSKSLDMIHYLISVGADVNIQDNWLDTPLSNICFYQDNLELVKVLIDAGSTTENINSWGNTPFMNACQGGHNRVASYLLENCGPNINLIGTYFKTNEQQKILEITLLEKNYDLSIQLLNAGALIENEQFLREIVDLQNFTFLLSLNISAFQQNANRLWFQLLQYEDNSERIEHLANIISQIVQKFPILISAKDHNGRIANAVATDINKKTLNSLFLWYGRYRPINNKAEHCSATTYVFKAIDESSLDGNGNYRPVAIKLMRFKEHFEKELIGRKLYSLQDEYIVQVIASYPSLSNDSEQSKETVSEWPDDIGESLFLGQDSSLTKSQVEKMFCVVMSLADRNMFVSLKQERFAGKNFEMIREIFRQLVTAVQHLHDHGILHGDIKPLNIMRVESTWKLIDLDAACIIGKENVCVKYSTGYCPPEAIFVANNDGTDHHSRSYIMPRSPHAIQAYPKECQPLIAHPSFDMWSLGCVLYQMCSRDALPLFIVGQDDNLTIDKSLDDNLYQLYDWKDHVKQKKLQQIEDPLAKNLLSLLLMKDPEKRPTISRILAHPFLSRKQTVRLSDAPAEYDLFLSYRVSSDLVIAESIYNRLTALGYKIWWDKKCLPVGLDWKEGFCAGLLNSKSYLCILSKDAINHPTNPKQNWNELQEHSDCDNVLLELRLAIEFRKLGYLERIVPFFRGEFNSSIEIYQEYNWKENYPNNAPNIIVEQVELSVKDQMEKQGLGCSILSQEKELISVNGLLKKLSENQGIFLVGKEERAYDNAIENIVKMLSQMNEKEKQLGSEEINEDDILTPKISMAHVNVIRRLHGEH